MRGIAPRCRQGGGGRGVGGGVSTVAAAAHQSLQHLPEVCIISVSLNSVISRQACFAFNTYQSNSKRHYCVVTADMYLQVAGTLLSSLPTMLSPCKHSMWGSTLGAIWGSAATCLQSPGGRGLLLGVTLTGHPCSSTLWFPALMLKLLAGCMFGSTSSFMTGCTLRLHEC